MELISLGSLEWFHHVSHPFNGWFEGLDGFGMVGWLNNCIFAFKISSARQHFWGNDEAKMKEFG